MGLINELKIFQSQYFLFFQRNRIMDEVPPLKLNQKYSEDLRNSRIKCEENDQVAAHCRVDHLASTPFRQRKNVSSYVLNYSPSKIHPNYNKPEVQMGLQKFRKYQNSTTNLPNLPSILENSQYHSSFHGHSQQKVTKGKESEGWFLKMNWPLEPKSNYQKNYGVKDGIIFNKENKDRIDNNHLAVFPNQQGQSRNSNYKIQFQPYAIKKQAEISIGSKDHLISKDIKNQLAISQYQRRYESVMEIAKPKQSLVSIYRKEAINRQNTKL